MVNLDPRAMRPSHPVGLTLSEIAVLSGATIHGATDVESTRVTGLTLNTNRVVPGDVYAALPGARAHGASFADAAIRDGAVAVLTDPAGLDLIGHQVAVPVLVLDHPRDLLGTLGAAIHDQPARALKLLAVTGTQGKTTTTRLAAETLETTGVSVGVIGTVGTRVGGRDLKTALTTPEAPDLHALFALMREEGVNTCAMEVSSHALVMGRVAGVIFDVAVFTNLGRDHLDFHADLEDYFKVKASLFTPERARRGLVNIDDEHGRRLLREASIPMRTFSVSDREADWRAVEMIPGADGTEFTLLGPNGISLDTRVPLAGDFNVSNAVAALAGLIELGHDPDQVAAGLAGSAGVPGRLEQVVAGQDFSVIVDYAHKPDAVEAALSTLRPLTGGRLIIVIGAGGDRDQGKRPVMGEIAARLADVVIVTDDNPRSEDPAQIRAEVLSGIPAKFSSGPQSGGAEVHEIGDRAKAINAAVNLAGPLDVVLIAGKGHETGQEVSGTMHPFDDREVARRALGDRGWS